MSNVIPFPRMPEASHPRRNTDRRAYPRGGRRATDTAGHAPLVLLVDHDANTNARCEAILAKLHFAVAPTRTIEEAESDGAGLASPQHRRSVGGGGRRAAAGERRRSTRVYLNEKMDPETLIEEIRRELRAYLRGV